MDVASGGLRVSMVLAIETCERVTRKRLRNMEVHSTKKAPPD